MPTPFRARRARIRSSLRAQGVPEAVRVSTVHRVQGSEAPVVLFDPADGSQPFLQTEEARVSPCSQQFWLVNERTGAQQLIDAGFWRAKAGH